MKRSIVILTLLTLATSAYAGTHVFNFDDASQLSDNWFIRDEKIWPQDPENVDWSVENGELVAISSDVCGGLSGNWILDDTYMDWVNYEMSCRLKLVETLVPYCNIYSNVIFAIHGNLTAATMLSLETRGAGGPWDRVVLGTADYQWRTQPSLEAPLEEGSWYTVRMVAKGTNYQIFVDDQLIIETESTRPSFAKGLVGFGIKNAEMHFDDFILTGDDIPVNLEPASQELIKTMGLKPMIPESEILNPNNMLSVSPRARLTTTWGQAKTH